MMDKLNREIGDWFLGLLTAVILAVVYALICWAGGELR